MDNYYQLSTINFQLLKNFHSSIPPLHNLLNSYSHSSHSFSSLETHSHSESLKCTGVFTWTNIEDVL